MPLIPILLSFIKSRYGATIITGLIALAILGIVYHKGVNDEKNDQLLNQLESSIELREKIDEETNNLPSDSDAAREWLRKRNESKPY